MLEEVGVDPTIKKLPPRSLSLKQLESLAKVIGEEQGKKLSEKLKSIQDHISLNPKMKNSEVGLGDLDPEYKPISDEDTVKVKQALKQVTQASPKVKLGAIKRRDSDLYASLESFIDPGSHKLSKDIESIPLKTLQELVDENYIKIDEECQNTIDALIQEDKDRKKPKELKIKELPKEFSCLDALQRRTGPTIGSLNSEIKFKSIDPMKIKDKKLQKEVSKLNSNRGANVYLNDLTPSILLRLNEDGDIALQDAQKKLLEE